MWCPTIYFLRHHGAVWGFGGCLSFRTANLLQWSILLICFYAHNNDVILHKGYCINDQSACALHSLTTFSTWNKSWILSSLGTAGHGLLNFKSGLCTLSMSKMSSLKAETVLDSDLCSWVQEHISKAFVETAWWTCRTPCSSLQPEAVLWMSGQSPQPPETAVPFPLHICFQHSCLQMLEVVALSSARVMPEYKQDQILPVKQ